MCTRSNRCHNLASGARLSGAGLPTLSGMADGSDTTLTAEVLDNVATLASSIKTFSAEHGGARAVIEYVGRRGARIVLVGEDGVWSDQFASGTDVARAACEAAGVPVNNEWERELMEQMRPSNDLWRSMARRVLAR